MRWWGWGDPARPPALGPRALELVRETVGAEGAASGRLRPPVALASVRLEPTALPEGARAELTGVLGEEGVRDNHAERVGARGRQGLPRPRAPARGRTRGRTGRGGVPVQPGAGARGAGGVRAPRGGRGAVRGRHERGRGRGAPARQARRGDRAGPASPRGGRAVGPRVADRDRAGGRARPRARAVPRGGGPDDGPPPAVLRARVGGRLRGDPLGRPGVDGLRALRGARARPAREHTDGGGGAPSAPGERRGPGPATPRGRLGGHGGRDPRARPACAPRATGRAVRRGLLRGLPGGRGDAARDGPGAHGAGGCTAQRRVGDTPDARPGRRRGAEGRSAGAAGPPRPSVPRRARLPRRLPGGARLRGRPRGGGSAAAGARTS